MDRSGCISACTLLFIISGQGLEKAVKACECYQAYHVGEYTAYSNWGTALAAYIVEQVSGETYADYVKENIFKPLDMNQTS